MSPLQRREEFSGRLYSHQPQFTEREDRGRGCGRGKEQVGPRVPVPVPDEPIDRCQREARRRDHGPDDGDPAHQFRLFQRRANSVVQFVSLPNAQRPGDAPLQPVYTGAHVARLPVLAVRLRHAPVRPGLLVSSSPHLLGTRACVRRRKPSPATTGAVNGIVTDRPERWCRASPSACRDRH